MDHSKLDLNFLTRNNLADELQIRLPKTMNELKKVIVDKHKNNLITEAIIYNCEKTFDVLINCLKNYELFTDYYLISIYREAIYNYKLFLNKYFIKRIIDELFELPVTFYTYSTLYQIENLKIDFDVKPKEKTSLNLEHRLEIANYILDHPKFNWELFNRNLDIKNIEIWKLIKNKIIEKGFDTRKFYQIFITQTISDTNILKLVPKKDFDLVINYSCNPQIKMTVEEAIIITRDLYSDFTFSLTEEKEERMIEIFKILNEKNESPEILNYLFNVYSFESLNVIEVFYQSLIPRMIRNLLNTPSKKLLNYVIETTKKLEIPYDSLKPKLNKRLSLLQTLL